VANRKRRRSSQRGRVNGAAMRRSSNGAAVRRLSTSPVGRSRSRRGSMFSRTGRRRAVVVVAATALLAGGGLAVASAITGTQNTASLSPSPAVTQPPSAPSAAAATHAATPTPTRAASSPAVRSTPESRQSGKPAHPAVPPHTAKPTASATATSCPSAAGRVSQARALLSHPDAVRGVTVVPAGPRDGTLGAADFAARTVTLYVRDCAKESTLQLAVVWMYETGQLVDVNSWGASTRDRWRQLRGTSSLTSDTQLRQDVAAVFAYWETGSTSSWQSPVPPPPPSKLPALSRFLHV